MGGGGKKHETNIKLRAFRANKPEAPRGLPRISGLAGFFQWFDSPGPLSPPLGLCPPLRIRAESASKINDCSVVASLQVISPADRPSGQGPRVSHAMRFARTRGPAPGRSCYCLL